MDVYQDLILNKKIDVELILTQEVAEKIDNKIINNIISDKSLKLKLYITREKTKAAFTVTDYFFSLGLFHLNGNYDYNRDLLSFEKKGIEWGNGLFEWYLQKAERI
jgi:predicted transcriptional regulator